MLASIPSATLYGIDAIGITVEVDSQQGLPTEIIVGLPDAVIRESRNRIRAALKNAGFKFPQKVFTINLAPAELRKEGASLDLPIATGILVNTQQLPTFEKTLFIGELSLNGDVQGVRGILSICHYARSQGYKRIVFPYANLPEAQLINGIDLIPIQNIQELKALPKPITPSDTHDTDTQPKPNICLSDVKGQSVAKRALTIAAAGAHNILFVGPPGSGKSLLMSCLPDILPPLTPDEALESHKIHGLGKTPGQAQHFSRKRPFRSPHHTISYAGMVGGGSTPQPGEISLAHQGVLFLDELPEFPRQILELLRQPLEEQKITISRAYGSVTYPSNFILATAMNPCPCGYLGDGPGKCHCHESLIRKYLKRISGPLLDRIDIVLEVPRLRGIDMTTAVPLNKKSATSKDIRNTVLACRNRQHQRQSEIPNARLNPLGVQEYCTPDPRLLGPLRPLLDNGHLSGRGYTKLLKVARTIADLDESPLILETHLQEALHYRGRLYR